MRNVSAARSSLDPANEELRFRDVRYQPFNYSGDAVPLPCTAVHWRDGYYVTPGGRVFANFPNGAHELKSRTIKGYSVVARSAPKMTIGVHQILCETFHGQPPIGKAVVRHLDGDPANNSLINLAWGSHADNMQDSIRHGTFMAGADRGAMAERQRGDRNSFAKLTRSSVLKMRERYANGESIAEIARRSGVGRDNVGKIVRRQSWTWLAPGAAA